MGTIIHLNKKLPKTKDAVAVIGLPGIGLVGKIAVDYWLKQIKAQKIGYIYSDSFPPSIHTDKGIITLIKDTIFYANIKGQDFIFVAGPAQPSLNPKTMPSYKHYEFAKKILYMLEDLNIKEIYTLAGIEIGEERIVKEPEIVVAATSPKMLKKIKAHKIKLINKDALISGTAGLILGLAKEKGIDGACIMGETSAQVVYSDPSASRKVLIMLQKMFKFKLDMKQLDKDAKEIEKAMTDINKHYLEEEKAILPDQKELKYFG